MFAWYVTNKEANASGILGYTEGDEYALKLQRGVYNGTTWTWNDTESLLFSNVSPNNAFFFRIEISSKENRKFNAKFKDIDSKLQENKLYVIEYNDIENNTEKYICLKNGESSYIKLYKLDAENKVKIDDKVLYEYVDDEIQLVDYKIQDTFRFYNYGLNEPSNSIITGTSYSLTNLTFNIEISGSEEKQYFYFALEFNEQESLQIIDGVECSNAYLYQKLLIGYISIEKIE